MCKMGLSPNPVKSRIEWECVLKTVKKRTTTQPFVIALFINTYYHKCSQYQCILVGMLDRGIIFKIFKKYFDFHFPSTLTFKLI